MSDPDLTVDPRQRESLAAGELCITTEPVPGSPIPRFTVRAVINAPPGKVWPLIDRCGDYARTLPGVSAAKELSREGNRIRARVTIGMPFPLPDLTSVTEAIHTVAPDERYVRSWQLVEGDYRANSGSWTLVPFDGDPARTLVVYQVHAVPRIRIPAAVQQMAQKKAIPRLFHRLRQLAVG